MRIHEAGALHGDFDFYTLRPGWLGVPDDVNALLPQLWASNVERADDGVLHIGGLSVQDLAAEFGTPAYVLDEDDFRARCRSWTEAFADADVYYAAKAFCSKAVLRAAVEEGLNVDVCTAGELAVALSAGLEPARLGLHGNNKSLAELRQAVELDLGRIVADSFTEIERLEEISASLGKRAKVMVRVNVGVEAHTHEYIATAHEDQKFGFSLAGGHAYEAARRVVAAEHLELVGLHSHIGSQIFDTAAFEVSAARVVRLQAKLQADLGVALPELDLGGGFGMAYTSQDDPQPPADIAASLGKIVAEECAAAGIDAPRLSIEPGRTLIGPAVFTLYEVGTVKPVTLSAGASRLYVSVDGGISDNIRTALYDATYSATVASRASQAAPALARVVGKHCEAGDIVVKDEFLPADIAAGDLLAVPGTGAYCRSMGSNYNHVPRPPVVAVRDGEARVILARETVDDLLRLDVG
ncbi:diaminopimelate decarboxylase [Glycomyces sp. TRM65418]|uniref:diaminopimelate decarboxylase n=1 Tax=Glycomyces sp. TRM65418 TaxID=2867006 RepID=UPI001CE5D4D2|nr:diaminopimelate decarboxylase [Glycomyces sp. TRM65418]MCC3764991.1 diaminopimelate decarboxylase [Glycomyces sp. TRM65418]QZD54624.1 diaminopimelate decarboxylase [Glycomyces sp. TRM65418]